MVEYLHYYQLKMDTLKEGLHIPNPPKKLSMRTFIKRLKVNRNK